MVDYKYTQNRDWFNRSEIKKNLLKYVSREEPNCILEIGCYEGLSSVFFADNLLDHPSSSLVCVDPFMTLEDNDHRKLLENDQEKNFDFNISNCNNTNKIIVNKITSDKFFETNNNYFNFIYIDGCHDVEFILRDMRNSFKYLYKNGIMWMDDYGGGDGIKIKNAMNTFLKMYEGKYEIIHVGYQLAIRKL